ncbi:hypothetical protein AN963_09845 [Brevibacillus choshinensis]|uniref:Uncharacterized protein n=1 Tax=Brevibacillus choshinensis TaxID=54911 RepID=A0ABR5NER5_BRECH|nr:hypothetical protein AN963_09845 [Brevibacillus choshinensis]
MAKIGGYTHYEPMLKHLSGCLYEGNITAPDQHFGNKKIHYNPQKMNLLHPESQYKVYTITISGGPQMKEQDLYRSSSIRLDWKCVRMER